MNEEKKENFKKVIKKLQGINSKFNNVFEHNFEDNFFDEEKNPFQHKIDKVEKNKV